MNYLLKFVVGIASIANWVFAEEAKLTVESEESQRISKYLELCKEFSSTLGPAGSWREGGIEIILDPLKIKEIEAKCKQNHIMKRGVSEQDAQQWSRVGIIAEDSYWMWVRDAVIFPSGAYGTYNRILWKASLQAPPGVAVVPVLPSKKIVLNLNYRHATRSWELELPRGGRKEGETLEQTAKRELQEETGYTVDKPIFLGKMATDSGLSTSLVPIYFARVGEKGEPSQDESEAIQAVIAFTKEEIKEGLARGYIELEVKGQQMKVPCRDSFLGFSILLAETKGLL